MSADPWPHRQGRAGLVPLLAAQSGMELRLLLRSPESLLVTLGVPLGILVFFSVVDVLPTGGSDPVTFLVPGVLAISVMSTALVALAIQTGFERKYGVLKRLGGTPLSRLGFLAAKALAVAAVLVVQTGLVLALAAGLLDWRPVGGWLALVAGMALGAAAFTALGLLIAGTLRAEATLALANALYLVMLVVSGLLFDADALPGSLAAVGQLLPSGALGVVVRAALAGEGQAWSALAVLAAWAAGAGLLAARLFRWEP